MARRFDYDLDDDAWVIRGVVLVGTKAEPGLEFTRGALLNACRLANGRRVHWGHARGRELAARVAKMSERPDRPAEAGLVGVARRVRLDGRRVRGDLHVFRESEHAQEVLDAWCYDQASLALSLLASHDGRDLPSGARRVTAFRRVASADLVPRGRTTRGLFD